jgi:vacuolar-type H+-ATPase subunit I/STV1
MAEQVKITSIDALQTFRANLIVFLTTAHRCADEVGDELRRTRLWLQHDQRLHWEGQYRQRSKLLALAQQELMSARLSDLRDRTVAQENAVRKAKQAVAEAEEKLRTVKTWTRDFDAQTDPLMKKMHSLRQLLDHDLPKALSYLVQAQRTLDAYAEISAPDTAPIREPAGGDLADSSSSDSPTP